MSTVIINNGPLSAEISTKGAAVSALYYNGTKIGERGITVGRYANRIAGARLSLLFGEFELSANENGNTLHGGAEGFGEKEWQVLESSSDLVLLQLVSKDGDQGFPGRMTVTAEYRLSGTELSITYRAVSDAPTVVNLTNHLYFNLNGGGPASDHTLKISADKVLETDEQLIPTGKLLDVRGTRFDHKRSKRFSPGFDCCYALNGSGMRAAAVLKGRESGLSMTVFTNQPGLQLYNTDTHICLETQHFPDSPNHPEFPTTTLFRGQVFETKTICSFEQEEK